ncbi:CBS domain-containing protein [Mycoplasma sp. 744]|uniref:magnesium transporter n=1 Tax=Mycoplasma sp. 744 TaxID=3108531 RepID=UPI002B1D932C|nr:CBS domain-containing protein [Mycoplasma sp. 744]MEA4115507.1 CBS domain-containing protein [Mycoplasma sp. 744]
MSDQNEVLNWNELLLEAVKKKDKTQIKKIADEIPYAELAEILENFTIEQIKYVLKNLDDDLASETFAYLNVELQKELATSFTNKWEIKLLQNLQSDELAHVVEELDENEKSKIYAYISNDKREELNKILSYNEEQVGNIMSVDISSLNNNLTCEQALNKIKKDFKNKNAEIVHYFYIVDEMEKLLGSITLEEIIFSNPETKIDDLYSPSAFVNANDTKEKAAQVFSENDFSVLPVVNDEKKLIGMITSDDVIDVINEKATENIYSDVGINAKDSNNYDYLKMPISTLVKSRIFWLIITIIFSTLLQIIIDVFLKDNTFETTFAALLPIVISVPIMTSRHSYITIKRNLELQEITDKDYKKVLKKEIKTAIIISLILALINILRLYIYYAIKGDFTIQNWLLTSLQQQKELTHTLIISSTLVIVISTLLSALIGTSIPIYTIKYKKNLSTFSTVFLGNLATLISISLMIISLVIARQII